MINHGYLPRMHLSSRPQCLLRAYPILKEQIAAEGLVRNLLVFRQTLSIASLSDAGSYGCSTIARDCGPSSQTVKE